MCIRDSYRIFLRFSGEIQGLSLIHISEPTRPVYISYAVFFLITSPPPAPLTTSHATIRRFTFFNDTATTEIYTLHIVGSVRCV